MLKPLEVLRRDHVGLVQQQLIGEGDLLGDFVGCALAFVNANARCGFPRQRTQARGIVVCWHRLPARA